MARPGFNVESTLERAWSSMAPASGPVTRISPMWERSNRPAEVRTALCSASSEPYFRGMFQPPKSVNVAPAASWTGCSGELRVESLMG